MEASPSWLTSCAQGTAFADLSSGAAQYLCLVHNFQKTCDAEDGAQGSSRNYVPLGVTRQNVLGVTRQNVLGVYKDAAKQGWLQRSDNQK
eukprot:scaffold97690_cov69-Phaeocystis_antarctica.AAC.2